VLPDVKLFDLFEILADNEFQNNVITINSLHNFMNSDKSHSDIQFIIKRYDKDKDEALSIDEFSNLLSPFFKNVLNLSPEKPMETNLLEKEDLKITLEKLNYNINKLVDKIETHKKGKFEICNSERLFKYGDDDLNKNKNSKDIQTSPFKKITNERIITKKGKNECNTNQKVIDPKYSKSKKQYPSIIQEFPSEEDKTSFVYKSYTNFKNHPLKVSDDYITGTVDISFVGSPNKKVQTGPCFDQSINEILINDKSYREMMDNYIFVHSKDIGKDNSSKSKNKVKDLKRLRSVTKPNQISLAAQRINEDYQDSLERNPSESSIKFTSNNYNNEEEEKLKRNTKNNSNFKNKIFLTSNKYSQEIEMMPTTVQNDSFTSKEDQNSFSNTNKQEIVNENLENLNILKDFLLKQIQIFSKIEDAKSKLIDCEDFSMVACFKMFDIFHKNGISFKSMKEGCLKIGLIVDDKDIYLLIKRFDKDHDNCLSYDEFYEMFIPFDIENSTFLNQRLVKNNRRELNSNTKECISSILKLLIERESINIEEKIKLISDPSWDYELFFKEIANEYDDYFNEENLKNYLGTENNCILENEIGILFKHYDKDGDMKVTLDEFVEELSN